MSPPTTGIPCEPNPTIPTIVERKGVVPQSCRTYQPETPRKEHEVCYVVCVARQCGVPQVPRGFGRKSPRSYEQRSYHSHSDLVPDTWLPVRSKAHCVYSALRNDRLDGTHTGTHVEAGRILSGVTDHFYLSQIRPRSKVRTGKLAENLQCPRDFGSRQPLWFQAQS